jgi:prepilin-type processing-associated H-X9-DG protein
MRRRTGFTIVEAMVVIAIVIIVCVALSPMFGRFHEISRRAACMSNLSAIGRGLDIYAKQYGGDYPWLTSDNRWDAPTGMNRERPPSERVTYNVSSLLFMLVRNGSSPGIFTCFARWDTPDPNTRLSDGDYAWDFSPCSRFPPPSGDYWEHISYSYQAPILDANGAWRSGVSQQSDPRLAILADTTPTYTGGNATFDWSNPDSADPRTGISPNHYPVGFPVLYADGHVEAADRADVGIDRDNIYSCAGSTGSPPKPETEQGPGTLDLSKHRSPTDSFLLGPKKWERQERAADSRSSDRR